MNFAGEFRVQAVLAALQSGIVIAGSLLTATILKARGYPETFSVLPLKLSFVRNWGFLLILLPLVWALATIWLERRQPDWFSKRWTVGTGVLLAAWLGWFLFTAMARAGSSLIQVIE
ncbi:hypothetical protein [Luteolibacter soli]|uniref:Uncharacterized protein n=1 Tax=Luteolibacter soli TaxID=3135280 RepID=A0ABU9AME2_9BACT